MKDFYIIMINHYKERICDKSIPILIRAQFKRTMEHFHEELQKIVITESIIL